MSQNRPYEPRSLSPDLTGKLDDFLAQHDFPCGYRSYCWKNDTHSAGFPDILSLEVQVMESVRSGGITLHDVESVVRWGSPQDTGQEIEICDEDGLGIGSKLLLTQFQGTPQVADHPEWPARYLYDSVKDIGPTFVSKVLRFALPAQYGVIDARVVRVFGEGDPVSNRHQWLSLTAYKSDPKYERWAIRGYNWPNGYGVWIDILRHLALKMSEKGIDCPHPQQFVDNGLRDAGVWTCADVEMALFAYASRVIAESKKTRKP